MALRGKENLSSISLGSSSGLSVTEPGMAVNRPYPVIVGTNQTPTQIEIDIDWHVNGAVTTISGADQSDLLITGSAQIITPTVTQR